MAAVAAPPSDRPPPQAAATAGTPRAHVFVVRGLLGLGSVLAVVAVLAVWANRQMLDADRWADTSAQVLQDPAVKSQLAAFLVDELYANVDVAEQLREALPPRLQPLAAPAAGGLRELSTRTTRALLGRPRVEQAWEAANRITAEQFIAIAEGRDGALGAQGNAVVLDLRRLVLDLVQRLGLPGRLAGQLPPNAGRVVVLQSDQVGLLQDVVGWLKGLALILPVLALGLMALAVYLGRGRRQATLLWVGIDLIAAGVVVLVLRNLLGSSVVDALADPAVEPAAEAAWSIGTGVLRDTAQALIIAAIPIVVGALLAGPSRPAVWARRHLAAPLRHHEGAAYVVLGTILLLVVAWGPIPATRKVIPVVIMAALAALGLRELRRQTLKEFPPAT
jgi:hypothetical protein